MKLYGFIVDKKLKNKKNKSFFWFHFIPNFAICLMLAFFSIIIFNPNTKLANSNAELNAIYLGNTNSNKVSLMVNVYWGEEYLNDMLNIFNKHNVKTTFFVGGMWIEKNNNMLKQIYNNKHEIANHGYFHKDMDKISYDSNISEIDVCSKLVKSIINYDMNLFAPPSGAYNKNTLKASYNLGYRTIMWSKDTIDWRDKNSDVIYKRATENLKGGDLILMHPTKATVEALPRILNYIKSNNLIATTVTDNLSL